MTRFRARPARGDHIRARTAPHPFLRTLALLELVLLWLLLVPAALAETTTATLSASSTLIDLGEPVHLSGTLAGDPGCTGGRAVTLEWRPADASGFATVASGTTATDGSFGFDQSPPHTGRYRAALPEQGACLASTSNEALVRVRALVDAALVAPSSEAGSCAEVAASVAPPRPGQIVELQRRTKDGWKVLERLTLDPSSRALAAPCFTFDDVGVVRLRVRWTAQDVLNETNASPVLGLEVTEAPWMAAIDDAIGTRRVSVVVGNDDAFVYAHAASKPRVPASNEKLLLSMALYDAFAPGSRIRTNAAASSADTTVVGKLWILGRGDPAVDRATMVSLARRIVSAGITRVRGRVMGSTSYFRRDWNAPGWNDVARDYVNRPTALVFERNDRSDPERRAAKALTEALEARGVHVRGKPGVGEPPGGLETIGSVVSRPLQHLITKMLRPSDNFIAEMLGKRLGARILGVPGTIAKGAASIQAWTDGHGTEFTLNDNSGLSYANRVTAQGIVRLLWVAEDQPWGPKLRRALPTGGQGTLRHRLRGVDVRAKTGTLEDVSALSGWVRTGSGTWLEFSILSYGMSKSTASDIEDRIVRILRNRFR